MPDGNISSVANFWTMPGTQLAVNLHLGAFEKKYRKYGASPNQVNNMIGMMTEGIVQLNAASQPQQFSNFQQLLQIAAATQGGPAPTVDTTQSKYTLDDIGTMVMSQGERLTVLEGKYK